MYTGKMDNIKLGNCRDFFFFRVFIEVWTDIYDIDSFVGIFETSRLSHGNSIKKRDVRREKN